MKRIAALGLILVAATAFVGAQDADGSGEAPLSILEALIRPAMLKVGLLPNLDGLLDGTVDMTLRWAPGMSSSLVGGFTNDSDELSETSGEAVVKAKVFNRAYDARLVLWEGLWTLAGEDGGGVGLTLGLSAGYHGLTQSVSGYKTALGETIYFNQDRSVHRVLPGLDLGLFAGSGGGFTAELSGSFLPYVMVFESGSKVYSTYDTAIPYSLRNTGMGARIGLDLATHGGAAGDLSLEVEASGVYGSFTTRQDVVTGNIKTTILTWAPYWQVSGGGTLEIQLGFLAPWLGMVPALTVGVDAELESFGGVLSELDLAYRFGLTVGTP